MDFKKFKASQSKLKDSIKKLAQPATNSYADDRFWTMKKDTVGNALATLRFLPQKDPSESPMVLTFRHAFQSAGKWFIEECPHTIGEKCPVCEHSSAIWNENETEARKHWRSKSYIANILVVKDKANPENEGKVFLYKFGKKIADKILERISDEDDGVNVFDITNGLDFKLKCTQVSNYNNFDTSSFAFKSTEVADGKEDLQEEIYNQIHELKEFMDPSKFKSYDVLQKKLLGAKTANRVPSLESEFSKEANKKPVVEETKEAVPFDPEKIDLDSDDSEEINFDELLG